MITDDTRIDFFITYSHADEVWAEWIATTLEDAGSHTVIQAWDFRPGHNFMLRINKALAARHTIGVLSPDYLTSVFTQAEWTAAYRQTLLGKDRGFIPVRVKPCDPSPLLGPVTYIDLVNLAEPEARQRLLHGTASHIDRRPRRPEFPGDSSPS